MQKSVGGIDRALRIIVGLAVVGAGIYFDSWWGAIGLIPLVTGLSCRCPGYVPLKISTWRS